MRAQGENLRNEKYISSDSYRDHTPNRQRLLSQEVEDTEPEDVVILNRHVSYTELQSI